MSDIDRGRALTVVKIVMNLSFNFYLLARAI